jgi:SAM-dependent methyltransferase
LKRGILLYQCNVCSEQCSTPVADLDRERPSCTKCGSTPRFRSIVSLLSKELFGKSMPVADFPVRRDIFGVGFSDWPVLADGLAKKLDYANTFFHQEPRLDITDIRPELLGRCDFIISSEVFEHVLPPVSRAFVNARRMLKPGGRLIFTVPYAGSGQTIEHYPRLYDYRVVEMAGSLMIENRTVTGEIERFENPVFHGGPGAALEMRIFTEEALLKEFRSAGFAEVEIMKDSDYEFGVYWSQPWSRPLVARNARKGAAK